MSRVQPELMSGTDEEGCVMAPMSESLMIFWIKGHSQVKDED